MSTMTETRRVYTDAEIKAGDPCTYYVGSDSYGDTVGEVIRFKSGTRNGQIKEIRLTGDNWHGPKVFRPEVRKDGTTDYLLVRDGRKQWYAGLVVGYREDYRDPHF